MKGISALLLRSASLSLTLDSEDIIKLIHLRRHYEIMDDLGDAYQVLSNLFITVKTPIDTREPVGRRGHPEMSAEKAASRLPQSPIAFLV